ncbi:hypothetical protein BAUCODRAFT_560453 [Baudoinia panamericana UAMH 10762]|uniref:Uncharacterized protein n=1 Tax=Baudoinia panamericana (strain UAMH 10762) TaxID=717646 RepID=M2N7I4_BAUPA|nr:uncharacterized protein BAUCODRAFT_560453 [Baudoinia panamericana UAMH 10762]EMC94770.1 hypothetical protein BAUCODRAFT_560453 [Baudoinia panamericana UAMH 10762]
MFRQAMQPDLSSVINLVLVIRTTLRLCRHALPSRTALIYMPVRVIVRMRMHRQRTQQPHPHHRRRCTVHRRKVEDAAGYAVSATLITAATVTGVARRQA